MFFEEEINKIFEHLFSTPLSNSIQQRALEERKLVQSIRQHLKMKNLILKRTADHKNIFYLGDAKDFQDKIHQFLLTTTDLFELFITIDENHQNHINEILDEIVSNINIPLKNMFHEKKIKTRTIQTIKCSTI